MGFFSYKASRDAAKKANEIAQLNAKLGNDLTNASNAAEAAKGNLQRYMQSVNNNRRLTAMGEAESANTVNSLRTADVATTQGFSRDIAAAEQQGSAVARQAAAGLGGDTADQVNRTTALRDSITKQMYTERTGQVASDEVLRAGAIAHTAIGGLDGTIVPPSLNYNRAVAQLQSVPNQFTTQLGAVMNGVSDFFTMKWGDTTSNANDGKASTSQSSWGAAYNKVANYYGGEQHANTTSGFGGVGHDAADSSPYFTSTDRQALSIGSGADDSSNTDEISSWFNF
jgi:hypothetical protein